MRLNSIEKSASWVAADNQTVTIQVEELYTRLWLSQIYQSTFFFVKIYDVHTKYWLDRAVHI